MLGKTAGAPNMPIAVSVSRRLRVYTYKKLENPALISSETLPERPGGGRYK